jgi:hypothetical protein
MVGASTATATRTAANTSTATRSATATRTTTSTRTVTPTPTVTQTPVPFGGACTTSSQCGSLGACVNTICEPAAPAPALSPWGLCAVILLLLSVGGFAMQRRMRGREES